MAKTKEPSPKLNINDEQKQLYIHLKNIDDKINSNNFIQQQLAVSRDGFVRLMEESIAKSEAEPEAEIVEAA